MKTESLAATRDARTAALIQRWLTGKNLTDEEKIEVHQRADIPLDVLSAGIGSPDALAAVAAAQTDLDRSSTRKHAKYPKLLPVYAAVFGQTDRTIKRWIKRGKETGELPPLDNPQHMAAWWRRNMDNQVPDYLIGFVGQSEPPDPLAENGDTGSTKGEPAGPRDFSQIKSLGIEENVQELRRTHAINKHLLDEALHSKEPNEQTTMLRQRNYERSFELLRKAETSLIELKKAAGDLIDKEKVRTELAQVFETLRLMRETMEQRIYNELQKTLPRRLARVLSALWKYLRPAIEKTRGDEENIFRNVEILDGPDAVTKLLAA